MPSERDATYNFLNRLEKIRDYGHMEFREVMIIKKYAKSKQRL